MNTLEQTESPKADLAIRILAIVVLYKMQASESSTLRSLLATKTISGTNDVDLKVLVWDNTPDREPDNGLHSDFLYRAAPCNPGLATPYNYALDIAWKEGYPWLLTLDQDSLLPPDYISRMAEHARHLQAKHDICGIVPQVYGDGRNLSPYFLAFRAIPRWFAHGFQGAPTSATYAVNSAAMLKVQAVRDVGGYDPMFPLDISDLILFHKFAEAGKSVYIAGDLLVQHNFSLLNKARRMSVQRYDALLLDECAFWDMQLGMLARLERIFRLAGRFCKDLLSRQNAPFRRRTLIEIRRRLTTSRRRRIEEWRKWAAERSGSIDHAYRQSV